MSVVDGHVAAEVAHIGLSVEVRHAQRLHQRGMGMAEFVPRDLDVQTRRNWIQYPVGDVLEHVMMAGLGAEHQIVGSDMVAPRAEHLQFLHDLGGQGHIAVTARGFGPAEFALVVVLADASRFGRQHFTVHYDGSVLQVQATPTKRQELRLAEAAADYQSNHLARCRAGMAGQRREQHPALFDRGGVPRPRDLFGRQNNATCGIRAGVVVRALDGVAEDGRDAIANVLQGLPGVALLLLLINEPAQVLVTHVLQLRVAERRQDVLEDACVVPSARVAQIPLLHELWYEAFIDELGECGLWVGWMQDVVDGLPVRGAGADHLVGERAHLVLVRQFRYGPKSHGLARPILIEGHVPDLAVDVDVSDWSLGLWGVRAGCQLVLPHQKNTLQWLLGSIPISGNVPRDSGEYGRPALPARREEGARRWPPWGIFEAPRD